MSVFLVEVPAEGEERGGEIFMRGRRSTGERDMEESSGGCEREREEGGGRILKQNDGGWVLTTPVGEKREGG
jgi:hypothetical protein